MHFTCLGRSKAGNKRGDSLPAEQILELAEEGKIEKQALSMLQETTSPTG
jgi:hypothetical protein